MRMLKAEHKALRCLHKEHAANRHKLLQVEFWSLGVGGSQALGQVSRDIVERATLRAFKAQMAEPWGPGPSRLCSERGISPPEDVPPLITILL